ncbi:MAG: hypothetical protein LQ347_004812 [Umbilicaria vellea]|nr:MAG: hypothetical protein LQ347_004812 [Umbilicaria vellea]
MAAPAPTQSLMFEGKLANGSVSTSLQPSTSSFPDTATVNSADPSDLITTPFLRPLIIAKPSPLRTLTSDQETKYASLHATASSWTAIPTTSARNSPDSPITPSERMWLTRECLLRYLRATKWNTADAATRLLGTLTWRREYGVEKLDAEYISPENATGKQVIMGYDNVARPCLYLIPANQNTKESERQVQHLVFMLERTIDLMPPGQETLALLVNSTGSTVNIGQGRAVLNILQTHYPERLGRALVIKIPWAANVFFKLITPFIDPMTREKLKFNEDLRKHVPSPQLLAAFGGEVEFKYEHGVYWPALEKLAKERKTEQLGRWLQGGSRIGELEAYLRGGNERSLAVVESEGLKTATNGENVGSGNDGVLG